MRNKIPKVFHWVYAVSAGLFVAGVLVQVFFAGMVVVSRLSGWSNHIELGHGLGIFILLMLVSMFPAGLSARMRRLTGLLFLVYFIQADVVIYMRSSVPYAAALHPVLALFDFLIGQHLFREAVRGLRSGADSDSREKHTDDVMEKQMQFQEP